MLFGYLFIGHNGSECTSLLAMQKYYNIKQGTHSFRDTPHSPRPARKKRGKKSIICVQCVHHFPHPKHLSHTSEILYQKILPFKQGQIGSCFIDSREMILRLKNISRDMHYYLYISHFECYCAQRMLMLHGSQ